MVLYFMLKALFVAVCLAMIPGILVWANPRKRFCEGGDDDKEGEEGAARRCAIGDSLWGVQTHGEHVTTAILTTSAAIGALMNIGLIAFSKENNSGKKDRVAFEKVATFFLLATSLILLTSTLASHKIAPALRTTAICLASVGASFAIMYSSAQIRKRWLAWQHRKGSEYVWRAGDHTHSSSVDRPF